MLFWEKLFIMSHSQSPRCAFVYVLSALAMRLIIAHAQQETEESLTNELQKDGAPKSNLNEELFKKLFAQRRKEQLEAVQSLMKISNYERLYKMIMTLIDKAMEILELSKTVIENADFIPNNNLFPQDINVKDALSNILENTALFGDIVLHIPDITHRILKAHQKWNSTIHWSLDFINRTRHLLDKSTLTMIHLVEQELNITEREHNYFNPYSSASVDKRKDIVRKKKILKKDKRKKGPQIIKIEL